MLKEKNGNTIVFSGNNRKKTEYIKAAVENGFSVLADKPMAINGTGFNQLVEAFDIAKEKDVLLYDIMTERFEINTILQKKISTIPEIFGNLETGTPANPAVTKESVHHFYKYVAGNVLIRPAWFFDAMQEGDGLVDVTTHLVDLIQWECFPGEIIDYKKDIKITSVKRWPTKLTLDQFSAITKQDSFPTYLKPHVKDGVLNAYSNGEINYQLRGVNAKVSVTWAYRAPEKSGDTHNSIMRGSKASLVIEQGSKQDFKPTLYIVPNENNPEDYSQVLQRNFGLVRNQYPGISLVKEKKRWRVEVADKYRIGHEAHFAQVTQKFLEYKEQGSLPDWEVPNMIAKYYTTTSAFEMARKAEYERSKE